jgi:hypothetical protein
LHVQDPWYELAQDLASAAEELWALSRCAQRLGAGYGAGYCERVAIRLSDYAKALTEADGDLSVVLPAEPPDYSGQQLPF